LTIDVLRTRVESDCLFFVDGMVAKFDHLKSWRFPAEELQVNHLHALDDVGQAHVVQQDVSNRNGTARRFEILPSLKAVNPVFLAIEGVDVDIPVRFLAVTECVHVNVQDRQVSRSRPASAYRSPLLPTMLSSTITVPDQST